MSTNLTAVITLICLTILIAVIYVYFHHKRTKMEPKTNPADAEAIKANFLANINHEIKTPMNGILGTLTLLKTTPTNTEQRELINTAYATSEALLNMFNDIIDLSQLENNSLELIQTDFSLTHIIENTASMMATAASAKDLEITTAISPRLPDMVVGDPIRLRQVIAHLLDNAIKHSSKGEIAVYAEPLLSNLRHHTIRIEVVDNGNDTGNRTQTNVVNAFSQTDSTDIGLALSLKLISLMKGQLKIESTANKGNRSWFTINVGNSSDSRASFPSQPHFAHSKALVIDESGQSCKSIVRHLTAWGISHESAQSEPEALEIIKTNQKNHTPFQFIFTAQSIGSISGEALAEKIHHQHSGEKFSIYLVANKNTNHKHNNETKNTFIKKYLTKPIRQSTLFDIVAKSEATQERSHLSMSNKMNPPKHNSPSQILVVEDNLVNQKVALGILKKLGYQADIANNGLQAVEALNNKHYDLVLMDCQMPLMNGFEATRKIRHLQKNERQTPIIAMTANTLESDKKKCLNAGMDDFLTKPIDIPQLSSVLNRYLKHSDITPAVAAGSLKGV